MSQGAPIRLDPRIEAAGLWPDFHASFIITLREWINGRLGPSYVAIVEERVYVTWGGGHLENLRRPDLAITHSRVREPEVRRESASPAGGPTPVIVAVALREEIRERSVAIKTVEGELVTALELLSPGNKHPGHEGRASYLAKRQELFDTGVHLVEMDFLLQGERMPLASPWPPCDRAVLVVRRYRPGAGELYPFGVTDPLPLVRVPLKSPDPDLLVDLQDVLEETWKRAGYERILKHLRGM